MDCMKPLDHITADDVVRSGACREGVAGWLRQHDVASSMPVSAILRQVDDDAAQYIRKAANLDGYGDVDGYGSGYGYGYGMGNVYCNVKGYG